jgi:DNA polymerase IV
MPATAIIHLDMDAFFAAVEQRDRPELRGKPVIVGGHPRRGVALAASYEARPFGVHSAMSMAVAMRRAPKAIVVPPRMTAYEEASDAIFAILSKVTPFIELLSLAVSTPPRAVAGWPTDPRQKCREFRCNGAGWQDRI